MTCNFALHNLLFVVHEKDGTCVCQASAKQVESTIKQAMGQWQWMELEIMKGMQQGIGTLGTRWK